MNVPLAAAVHVVPFGEVSIEYPAVDALPPTPHGCDGSTAKSVMSTAAGSCTVSAFGPPIRSVVLSQPLPVWSIALSGPQKKTEKSTPGRSP